MSCTVCWGRALDPDFPVTVHEYSCLGVNNPIIKHRTVLVGNVEFTTVATQSTGTRDLISSCKINKIYQINLNFNHLNYMKSSVMQTA